MDNRDQSHAGVYLGAILGVAAGAVIGAKVNGWNGALAAAYCGMVCGATVGGGLSGLLPRVRARQVRAEAAALLAFGIGGLGGVGLGFWVGTLGIQRLSSGTGMFAGLALFGIVAALTVSSIKDADPLVFYLLLWATIGAGGLARVALEIAPGYPFVLAVGLITGSILGTGIGHAFAMSDQDSRQRRYRGR